MRKKRAHIASGSHALAYECGGDLHRGGALDQCGALRERGGIDGESRPRIHHHTKARQNLVGLTPPVYVEDIVGTDK